MKANAPEKIYIHVRANKELGTTWHGKKITNNGIEYVRKDAFIEKACKFLQDRIEHDSIDYPMATHWLIDDFKEYMEESKI